MRNLARAVIALVVATALLLVAAYNYHYWPFESGNNSSASRPQGSHAVGVNGGTFRFGNGISITVPKGAVDAETTLSVGAPAHEPAGGSTPLAGLNRATVAFDVSLSRGARGDIQPGKPLAITIPLKGRMLPGGTKPSQALLYTGLGNGYMFVPARVSGGVLTASLTHLSPKYITYVDEDKFAREFGIDGQSITRSQDCKSEVTASATGKVKFGSGNKGWSNADKYSPINACLSAGSDGNPRVGIVNNRYYVLSVAASSGVSIETSRGDTDEELTKLFAQKVFPNKKIAAFLGRDGRLVATTPSGSLPARVQFKADPNTFLAESGLFAIKFTAGLLTGKSGNELTRSVNALFDSADVVDCLQTTLDISQGKAFDFGFDDALKLVTSKCMSTIGQALGMPSNPWDLFGKWFQVVGEGLSGGLQTVRTAYEGIRMQTIDGNPPVTVRVESTVPPCPSVDVLVRAWDRDMPAATRADMDRFHYSHSRIVSQDWDKCVDGWQYIHQILELDVNNKPIIAVNALFHFERGAWHVIEFGEAFGEPNPVICSDRVPAAVRPSWWTC